MKDIEQLDEAIIKQALKEGLITAEEAQEMAMLYLNEYDFLPIASTMSHSQYSNRPHSFS